MIFINVIRYFYIQQEPRTNKRYYINDYKNSFACICTRINFDSIIFMAYIKKRNDTHDNEVTIYCEAIVVAVVKVCRLMQRAYKSIYLLHILIWMSSYVCVLWAGDSHCSFNIFWIIKEMPARLDVDRLINSKLKISIMMKSLIQFPYRSNSLKCVHLFLFNIFYRSIFCQIEHLLPNTITILLIILYIFYVYMCIKALQPKFLFYRFLFLFLSILYYFSYTLLNL